MKCFPLFFMAFLFFSFTSCRFAGGKRINGNGRVETVSKSVGSFSGVNVEGGIDVILVTGNNNLKIEADENLMEYIMVKNDDGTVKVYSKDGYDLNSTSGIKVYATAPSFKNAEISGSGNIISQSLIKGTDDLHIDIKGSGDVRLEVDMPKIFAEIKGSGSVKLEGRTQNFDVEIKGSGDIICFNLLSENTSVDIAGSGNAEVFASKKLNVDIKGAGDVKYKGTASVTQHIMGSGNVNKVD